MNELREILIGGQTFKLGGLDGIGNEWVWEKAKDGFPTSYVNSPDPNAYPPAEPDGYTYTPLGQLAQGIAMGSGSYVGTGEGSGQTRNTILLPRKVRFVLILDASGTTSDYGFLVYGHQYGRSYTQSESASYSAHTLIHVYWEDGKVSWWDGTSNASKQLNAEGKTYNYYYM